MRLVMPGHRRGVLSTTGSHHLQGHVAATFVAVLGRTVSVAIDLI